MNGKGFLKGIQTNANEKQTQTDESLLNSLLLELLQKTQTQLIMRSVVDVPNEVLQPMQTPTKKQARKKDK